MAASLAALSLTASASPAGASVTLGQLDPGASPVRCAADIDFGQPTVTSGNSYVVPEVGTITSWTTKASSTAVQSMTMKVFRKIGEPSTYEVVGHEGPRALTPGGTAGNTFPANVPVKPGDVLGNYTVTDVPGGDPYACAFIVPHGEGESILYKQGNLADGASAGPFLNDFDYRLNITAVLNPTSTFTLGAITHNKKKGTATLTANVPNPGQLALSGDGVKSADAALNDPGTAQLSIRATGKKKQKLNQKGKVKVNPVITYTPTGGDPSTQSTKLKLKKR